MSNIVFNWTPDNLIDVGIVFGFFLGFMVFSLCSLADVVTEYFKNKKKDKK